MDYYVNFYSHGLFDQMKLNKSSQQSEINILFQDDNGEGEGIKEAIFSLPTPENYNYDNAQFSISEKEAILLVNLLIFHYNMVIRRLYYISQSH